jgi:hypothetical protein
MVEIKLIDFILLMSFVLCSLEYNKKMMINCSTTPTTCQLNLINVNRWHHGIYECVARNIVGTIGRFYEIDVQCKISKSKYSDFE